MLKKTTTTSLLIGLVSAFGLIGLTGCEAPQEPQQPVAETESTLSPEQADQERPAEPPMEELAAGDHPGDQPPQMGAPQQQPQGQAQGDPMQQPQAAPPPAMDGEVTDEELDQFAQAVELTSELQQEENLQARMMEAGSQEEQHQIQEEFVTQLQQEIENTGMSFPEYMAMAQRIEQDPELQQRFAERMQAN